MRDKFSAPRRRVQALFASTALTTLAALSTPAAAQTADATAAADEAEVETIVVTGSRISRPDLNSSSPVTVLAAEEFKLSGQVNVEQVLNALPQTTPGTTSFSNNPGGGVATVDLRALGRPRTLVLVNGRRYMFYDTTQTVDLNTIPSFLIGGVETVTGGASAVYGSDAIAGVVNFRLRQDLNGGEVGGQYNVTGEGDGDRWNAHLAYGTDFAEGNGHITAFGEYYKRGSIKAGARGYSRNIFNEGTGANAGLLLPGGNTTVPAGRFFTPGTQTVAAGNGLPSATLPLGQGTAFGSGTLGATYDDAAGNARAFVNPADAYNFYPDNYLMVPQERWLIGTYGKYEVSELFNPYFELTFINNKVESELAPTPVTGTYGVRTNNPYLSAQDRAALAQIDANEAAIDAARTARGLSAIYNNPGIVNLQVFRRMNDVGFRHQTDERNAYRILLGTEGQLTDTLRYDAYYSYARTSHTQRQEGNISRSAFTAALLGTAANGGELDIFGDGTVTEDMARRIRVDTTNLIESQLQVAQASINGDLFDFGMGGGPAGFALGGEWRQTSAAYKPDQALASGDVIGFNAGTPTGGGYNVKEVFGELLIPIVADRPFFDRLNVRGAARYSHYSLDGVDGAFTWAAGAEWAPIPDIMFRGQFQRAIRAPNVQELFAGLATGFPGAIDPCGAQSPAANRTAAVRALCEATGVPASAVFTNQVQSNTQLEQLGGGNPDLQEEVSDTFTVGAVMRPSFVPGLNITADYFNIKIDDFIASFGGGLNNTLNLCYNVLQDINSPYCQVAKSRNPVTGAFGNPFVPIINSANIAKLKTTGYDFQVDYSTDVGFGLMGEESRFGFNVLATRLLKNDVTPVVDQPDIVQHCAGNFGPTCAVATGYRTSPQPKWKFTSRLNWIDGPLTSSLRFRYLGKLRDERIENGGRAPNTIAVPTLKSKLYTDLSFSYDVNEALTVNAGVNNLFDVQPQILPDERDEQNGTYPSLYDALGRDFFISATLKF